MIQTTEDVARLNSSLLMLDAIASNESFERIGNLLYSTDALFRGLVKSKYNGVITREAIIEHGIDENHAVFGKIARPSGLRSVVGAGLFAFLQYPLSIIEQMLRLLMDRGPAGRKAALNMVLVYPVIFGGMSAVPGFEMWDWMTKWVQRLTGSNVTNLNMVMAKAMDEIGISDPSAKDMLMGGAVSSKLFDVDFSSRISVQFPFQPFLDALLSPDSNGMTTQSQALQFLGPLATIPVGAMGMLNAVEQGSSGTDAFVDNLAPIALRNIKKASDLATGDLRNTKGKLLLPSPEENPELFGGNATDEVARQLMGFRPSVVSEASKAHFYQSVEQTSDTAQRAKTYKRVAKAYLEARNGEEGGEEALAKAFKEAWEYNQNSDVPKSRKEFMNTLKRSVKEQVNQEDNPLKQRKGINEDRRLTEIPQRYGLPRLEGHLQDK
jgi:hypothetical protein